ncbi:MAG: hypothetical protein ABSG83_04735 [Roseiarcus sp.]|jgi:hypothetical protein
MSEIADLPGSRGRRPRRKPDVAAIVPRSRVDLALAGFGVLIALSSLGFAGYMVSDIDRPTRVAGMEYLAIFARPSRSPTPSDARVGALSAPGARDPSERALDRTPTGSIPDRAGAGPVADGVAPPALAAGSAAAPAFKLLYVSEGEGLLQTDVGLLHVKAGDVLPRLGRIESIEKVGQRWVLLSENGAALDWPPTPKP